jgi:hypothetical protein
MLTYSIAKDESDAAWAMLPTLFIEELLTMLMNADLQHS